MRVRYVALFVAAIALLVVIAGCASSAPATPSPTASSNRGIPVATASPVPAPAIPAEDVKQTECFACHGPGELPTIPDHSVMQDNPALCEQCHRPAK